MPLKVKKNSKTLISPGLKGNAFVCENILKEHVKSQIDMNCFADDNTSVWEDGSTNNAVKKTNLWLGANLPRLMSRTWPPLVPPGLNPLSY